MELQFKEQFHDARVIVIPGTRQKVSRTQQNEQLNEWIHCVHGLEFPVLSVHQPYALMLVEGKKPFEYRSWKLPKRYVGQRIFIQATKMMDDFDPQFAEKEAFTECMYRAYDNELNSMILGSVVFGESEESIECTVYGMKKLLFKWPVFDPIKLDNPLKFIPGKQRIWKIKF